MDGILVIRKEKGYTSHDVVAKLRGILHMKKIGHTGTLDPAAEGVLPVALGRGTRLVELLTEKNIRGSFKAGRFHRHPGHDRNHSFRETGNGYRRGSPGNGCFFCGRTNAGSADVFRSESGRKEALRAGQRRKNHRAQTAPCGFL